MENNNITYELCLLNIKNTILEKEYAIQCMKHDENNNGWNYDYPAWIKDLNKKIETEINDLALTLKQKVSEKDNNV